MVGETNDERFEANGDDKLAAEKARTRKSVKKDKKQPEDKQPVIQLEKKSA